VRGLEAVARLMPFAPGGAVVVARAYILAFSAGETVAAMLDRVRGLRQWGLGRTRRLGVLVCAVPGGETGAREVGALLQHAAGQGLAGVVIAGPPDAVAPWEEAARLADMHGLFLVACTDMP
jgi:DUF1009 family protein